MSKLLRGLGAVLVVVGVAGCGTGQADAGAAGPSPTLSVAAPTAGASVSPPFTVNLSSSVPIGAPETGAHHVHLFFDGNDGEYTIAYATTVEVTELPAGLAPGRHVLNASLRNPDHSPAGVETQIEVMTGPAGGPPADGSSGGGANGY